ncbi:MAG: hypothetical protein F4Z96_06740 [Chloroflexi bacterium]|nr:hypothetical protein [Chloroflexota bacterium]
MFCKHLVYLPDIGPGGAAQHTEDHDDGLEASTYTEADVFAPEYRPPRLDRVWFPAGDGGYGQVQSLQQLLLRWFGVAGLDVEVEVDSVDDDSDVPDGEEVVDQPERLPTAPSSETPQTILNKRRVARIVDKLEGAMTSSQFLEGRSPDYLATDLRVASVLLGVGLGKGWLERDRFFELTHSIWSSLFFGRGPGTEGWLEHRARTSEDRKAFLGSMRSAELSAALIGWYLAALTPHSGMSPEGARFSLAAALAVARLPWLWNGGSDDDIRTELSLLLAHTAERGADDQERSSWAAAEWVRLVRRGQALRRLEAAIRDARLEVLRERIRVDELRPGDVLWQGTAGLGVVLRPRSRSGRDSVPVLKLEGDGGETAFVAWATVPVRALLDVDVIPWTQEFDHGPRRVLREFVHELSMAVPRP